MIINIIILTGLYLYIHFENEYHTPIREQYGKGISLSEQNIYITISTFMSVRPYGGSVRPSRPTSKFSIPAGV